MSEVHAQRVHTRPVVLDVGADRGALIIQTGAASRGVEIEINRAGAPRTHQDVAERRLNGRTVFAAIFPSLGAGDYTVWGPDPRNPMQITIAGGEVVTLDWR